jgi:3-oxoacyl-[acyl-carrier-protein] synthase II
VDDDQRIVVTGMGVVSALGHNLVDTWEGLSTGRSGVEKIHLFDPHRLSVQIAAQVPNWQPADYMPKKEARRMDRYSQFAVAAAHEAVRHSGLGHFEGSDRTGVMVGTGIGGIITTEAQFRVLDTRGPERVSPFVVPMMLPNMASGQVSIALGARGPNLAPVSACSSAADALGLAAETIRRGDADIMLAGGAEAPICEMAVAGFAAARALSVRNERPEVASRPFDAERDGFVMGEGAGILVLERADYAQARGAQILAEICGYATVGDAYHITQPAEGGDGGVRAMSMALNNAKIEPADVDYLNAHGTSTPLNDKFETMAIKTVFGESAWDISISSTKSMTAHLLGAAGAIEAVASIQAIREGLIPPTINLEHPDPECDLDYTPNVARKRDVRVAISNSMGFGGHNACLVFRRWEA